MLPGNVFKSSVNIEEIIRLSLCYLMRTVLANIEVGISVCGTSFDFPIFIRCISYL